MGHQRVCKSNVVGIDVNDMSLRIECGPTPLSTAVETGEHDRLLVDLIWDELAVTRKGMKLLQRPLMSFWRARSEQVLCKNLPGKGRGFNRDGLLFCGNLARHRAGWKFSVLNGKKRRAVDAIEEKQISLLGGLGDSGY